MENSRSKDEIYSQAKNQHALLDSRLHMLMRKAYLTADEEVEIRTLKKKKLYYKDVMDKAAKLEQRKETE